jgi:hypothetical protein
MFAGNPIVLKITSTKQKRLLYNYQNSRETTKAMEVIKTYCTRTMPFSPMAMLLTKLLAILLMPSLI